MEYGVTTVSPFVTHPPSNKEEGEEEEMKEEEEDIKNIKRWYNSSYLLFILCWNR